MTDSAETSLGRSISIGAAWMLGVRLSIKSLGLISSIVLARLLMPEDFGVIALAMSVYAFIRLIREFGFGFALIQNQQATTEHYDTAWTLQVLLSSVATCILLVIAPIAADFYDDARLLPVLLALALTFFITGFENIGIIDFQKNMTFDKVFYLGVIPKVVSFVCTIALAIYLRNYWALLLGTVINKTLLLVLSYLMNSYRPRFTLSVWQQLVGFSSWLMVNNMIKYVNRHGQNIVLAKFGGAPLVGLFSVASEFATIVSLEIVQPINTAAYPGYSKVAHDLNSLRSTFINVVEVVSALAIPGGIGIAALAPVFVPVLLGNQWLQAIDIVPFIACASIFVSLSTAFDMVLMSTGRQRITTFLMVLRLILFFPMMYVLLKSDGAVGVAIAILISNLIVFPLYLVVLSRYLKISLLDFSRVVWRPLLASAVMYALTARYVNMLGSMELNLAGLAALASTMALGVTIFFICSYTLWRIVGAPSGVEERFLSVVRSKLRVFS